MVFTDTYRPRVRRLIVVAFLVAGCSGGATATVTPTAVPTQEAVATAEPTDDATPVGTGVITFGTGYNADTLEITGAKSSFKDTVKSIAYSASLIDAVGSTSITLVIASQSTSGTEKTIIKTDVDVSDPADDMFANKLDLAALVGRKPGTYVMRYVRGGDVLAEGNFKLTK